MIDIPGDWSLLPPRGRRERQAVAGSMSIFSCLSSGVSAWETMLGVKNRFSLWAHYRVLVAADSLVVYGQIFPSEKLFLFFFFSSGKQKGSEQPVEDETQPALLNSHYEERGFFGRKLERHTQRAGAGCRKTQFCNAAGGKALTFSREELASRGLKVGICE